MTSEKEVLISGCVVVIMWLVNTVVIYKFITILNIPLLLVILIFEVVVYKILFYITKKLKTAILPMLVLNIAVLLIFQDMIFIYNLLCSIAVGFALLYIYEKMNFDQYVPFLYTWSSEQNVSSMFSFDIEEKKEEINSLTYERRKLQKIKLSKIRLVKKPLYFLKYKNKYIYDISDKKYIYLLKDEIQEGGINFIDAPFGYGKTHFINELRNQKTSRWERIDIDEIGPTDNPIYFIRKSLLESVSFNHRYRINKRKLGFVFLLVFSVMLSTSNIWIKFPVASDMQQLVIYCIYIIYIVVAFLYTGELLHWLAKFSLEVRELLKDDIIFILKKHDNCILVIENIDRIETIQIKELSILLDKIKKNNINNTVILTGDEAKISKKLNEKDDNNESFIKKYYTKKVCLPTPYEAARIEFIKKIYNENLPERFEYIYKADSEKQKFIIDNQKVFFPQNLMDTLYSFNISRRPVEELYRDLLRNMQVLTNYDIECIRKKFFKVDKLTEQQIFEELKVFQMEKYKIYSKVNLVGIIEFCYISNILDELLGEITSRTYYEKILKNISFEKTNNFQEIIDAFISEADKYISKNCLTSIEKLMKEYCELLQDPHLKNKYKLKHLKTINVINDMYSEKGVFHNYKDKATILKIIKDVENLSLSELCDISNLKVDFKIIDLTQKFIEPEFSFPILHRVISLYFNDLGYKTNEQIIVVKNLLEKIQRDVYLKNTEFSKKLLSSVAYYENKTITEPQYSMPYLSYSVLGIKDLVIREEIVVAYYKKYKQEGYFEWFDELLKSVDNKTLFENVD